MEFFLIKCGERQRIGLTLLHEAIVVRVAFSECGKSRHDAPQLSAAGAK